MTNWNNWVDWGGDVPSYQSLNNLHGPANPFASYQWLRPTPAFPVASGYQFPMFSPTGSPNYPMFGPNAAVPNSLPGAGLLPQMTWAEQVAATGYPAPRPSTLPRVPMFDAAGVPSSIPRPMFDAAGNPLL